MPRQAIHTDNAPAALGPYSQALHAGNMLFISGQLGIAPATNQMSDSVLDQTRQALTNIQTIVTEAGLTMSQIVQVQIFLADMNDFISINKIYKTFFSEPYPARAVVQAARLPKDAKIEILATALK